MHRPMNVKFRVNLPNFGTHLLHNTLNSPQNYILSHSSILHHGGHLGETTDCEARI